MTNTNKCNLTIPKLLYHGTALFNYKYGIKDQGLNNQMLQKFPEHYKTVGYVFLTTSKEEAERYGFIQALNILNQKKEILEKRLASEEIIKKSIILGIRTKRYLNNISNDPEFGGNGWDSHTYRINCPINKKDIIPLKITNLLDEGDYYL